MAYDDEDTWTDEEDTDVQDEPEEPDVPEPPPEPPPEPEEPPPPTEAAPEPRQRLLYDDFEDEAPPLAPDDRTEAPQPTQYAQTATGTMTDAGPEQPEPKKRLLYDDSEDATPASAEGKKRVLYEEPEGAFGTFTRELLHGAPPAVVGTVTGAATGGALGAAGFNPITVLGGTVAGGIAGGFLADTAKDAGLKALGHDDNALRAANAQENPWSARAGSFLSQAAGGAAGLGRAAVTGTARLVGGLIAGGWETASQLYHGKSLAQAAPDILTQAAGGATFAGSRPWTRWGEQQGARVGSKFAGTPEAAPVQPAATPPDQGNLPFPSTELPYNPKTGYAPQEAQIGGGERQLGLPLDQPPPPETRPGVSTQPELPLEPPPTVNREGQLGLTINAPHPDSTHTTPSTGYGTGSRDPMPSGAGTAREAAPPTPLARQPNQNPIGSPEGPHSAEVRGITAEPPPDAGSGIHVLQPGQMDFDASARDQDQDRARRATADDVRATARTGAGTTGPAVGGDYSARAGTGAAPGRGHPRDNRTAGPYEPHPAVPGRAAAGEHVHDQPAGCRSLWPGEICRRPQRTGHAVLQSYERARALHHQE